MPAAPTAARRAALVALVAFGCYAGTLRNGFAFDDHWAIESNPVVNGELGALQAFARNWWGRPGVERVAHYRPLAVLSLAVDGRVGRGSSLPFHLENVALHALIAALLYLLVRRVGEAAALGGALFFAVFAAPSEAVEAIVGRADLLTALAVLLGLALHRRPGPRAAAGAFALLAAATLCKENALVAPAAWLAVDLCAPAETPLRRRAVRFAGYVAVLVGSLALRGLVLHSFALPHTVARAYNPLAFAPAAQRIFGAGRVFLERYLAGMLDPRRRLYDCSWRACDVSDAGDPLAWLGLVLALLPLALAIALRRRGPVASAGLAWWGAFFLPFSNIPLASMTVYAERLLYLPSLGLCVALGAGVDALAHRLPRGAIAWLLLGALGYANAFALQARHRAWHDDASLFASGLASAPESLIVLENSADQAELRRDWPEAERLARAALSLDDTEASSHDVLARALDAQDRTAESEAEFRRCLALERTDAHVLDFATFLARHGRYREARDEVAAQRRASPSDGRLLDLDRRLQAELVPGP